VCVCVCEGTEQPEAVHITAGFGCGQ
jgi:hypothetical protein